MSAARCATIVAGHPVAEKPVNSSRMTAIAGLILLTTATTATTATTVSAQQSSATLGVTALASAYAYLGGEAGGATLDLAGSGFTLSPHTELVMWGLGTVAGDAASGMLRLAGTTSQGAIVSATGLSTADGMSEESLSVAFSNLDDAALQGTFEGELPASAVNNRQRFSVPEPGSAAMYTLAPAAMVGIGKRSRRQRAGESKA